VARTPGLTGGPHTGHSVVLQERRGPRARHQRARDTRSSRKYGYFLFLRWIRVFFSSLRCFFFAMRLRRFLMTEPIRPPSLRHNGRRARHHSPAAGRLGTRPKCREKRERQPLTQSTSVPATAPRWDDPGILRRASAPTGAHSRQSRRHKHPGFAGAAHRPSDVRHLRKRSKLERVPWMLRAVPVTRAQQPVRALRQCRRRPPAGTG
jgi:hypothetical protein